MFFFIFSKIKSNEEEDYGTLSFKTPYYVHDMSLWTKFSSPEEENEILTDLKTFVLAQTCGLIKIFDPIPELTYKCPKTEKESRLFRLYWQANRGILTRKICNDLQNQLRDNIVANCEKRSIPLELR